MTMTAATITHETRTYTFPVVVEGRFLALAGKTPKVFHPFTLVRKGEDRDEETGRVYVTYEWTGPAFVQREGWTLAASVDWVDDKPSTVFYRPGVPVPEAPTCDHCKAKRHRSRTYVAVNEQGKTLTLGGNCAKQYWGTHLKYLPFWEEMGTALVPTDDDDMKWGVGAVSRVAYDVRTVLALAIPHIRSFGYVKATDDQVPTKTRVQNLHVAFDLWGPGPVTVPVENRPEDLKGIDNVELASDEEVDRLIEWAMGQPADNGYWQTVQEALKNGWFAPRVLGFIVALPHGFSKRPVARPEPRTLRHVGVPGERMKVPMKLTVVRTSTFETVYGMTTLTVLHDEDGNVLKSFGKMPRELREEGDTAPVTFYVKSHGEYRGTPETVINRVS